MDVDNLLIIQNTLKGKKIRHKYIHRTSVSTSSTKISKGLAFTAGQVQHSTQICTHHAYLCTCRSLKTRIPSKIITSYTFIWQNIYNIYFLMIWIFVPYKCKYTLSRMLLPLLLPCISILWYHKKDSLRN